MMKNRYFSFGITLALLSAQAMPSAANALGVGIVAQERQGEQDAAMEAMKRGEIMPYNRLKKIVEKETRARIVGETLRYTNRGWIYVLRVRGAKGKISSLIVDAKTAEIRRKR